MAHRFRRLHLVDELGLSRTATFGHDIVVRAPGRRWLLLGLGPDPAALARQLPPGAEVRYIECQDCIDQAGPDWRAAIPEAWQRVEAFDPLTAGTIALYRQAMALFPTFWGPVRAALLLPRPATEAGTGGRLVLVPQVPGSLLLPAVAAGFAAEGFTVRAVDRAGLLETLERARPALYLSVNFAGLDRLGEVQALLARAGVPVAVWCADNPFHLLSGQRTVAWRGLRLFVTDPWFVEPLRRHGAGFAAHLPLAADPRFFAAAPDRPELADRLLFVGHSAFAGKDGFFAGQRLRRDVLALAGEGLDRGERPDFGWWARRLGVETFWPGPAARRVGLGAEETGLLWRSRVIAGAAATGRLTVCGDAAWNTLVAAPFDFLPPVPYGPELAGMYASARFVVGTVSPLLPHGLTQRHFDVWAAGGCLLTDATPGLALFPDELARPVTYARAGDIPRLAREREGDRDDLIAAWKAEIAAGHTYRQRARRILESLD